MHSHMCGFGTAEPGSQITDLSERRRAAVCRPCFSTCIKAASAQGKFWAQVHVPSRRGCVQRVCNQLNSTTWTKKLEASVVKAYCGMLSAALVKLLLVGIVVVNCQNQEKASPPCHFCTSHALTPTQTTAASAGPSNSGSPPA